MCEGCEANLPLSFPQKRESSPEEVAWTPAFAGVTALLASLPRIPAKSILYRLSMPFDRAAKLCYNEGWATPVMSHEIRARSDR